MKKMIFSALALFAFGFANAQDEDGGFQAGIHVGMPIGDLADFYSFNFGVDVAYMWPVGEGFGLGLTTGYTMYPGEEQTMEFFGEEVTIEALDAAFIPVAAAAKYSITENFFLGADLGYAVYVGDGEGDGGFYYQPKVGYQMSTIDIFLGYKGISSDGEALSSINLGAAYKF